MHPASTIIPTPTRVRLSRWVVAAAALIGVAACQSMPAAALSAADETADTILSNARVYTVETSQPWAEAVAIRDGKILAVGSVADIAARRGPQTEVVDLGGRLLMPAFGDAHAHPIFGGMSHARCALHSGRTVDDYRAIISACIAAAPDTGVIYGVGWEDSLFPPNGSPRKEVLDALATDRPLIFVSVGGHSLWLNSRALELAGITRDTPDPANGVIDRDASGEPSGALQEAAMALADAIVPAPTEADLQTAIAYTVEHFNSLGITSWHDAGVEFTADGGSSVIDAYRVVRDRGDLTMHVAIDLKWQNENTLDQLPALYRAQQTAADMGFVANSVKFYLDGVIPQQTAAMLAPYEGTDVRGESHISPDILDLAVTTIEAHGMQAHVHAIGDGAVREALDAFAVARAHNGPMDGRHMISHLNVIDPADQPRFGQLGVTAIFQPLWACDEPYMRLTIERIGPARAGYIYPANSVLKGGGRIAYGADWSVASANPLEGLEVALTRIAPGVTDAAPLIAGERVTLEQAVRAYTLDVAYVNHLDDRTGSIAAGKSADLIVLDHDIFTIPATDISKTKVLVTLFEGRAVFGDLDAIAP